MNFLISYDFIFYKGARNRSRTNTFFLSKALPRPLRPGVKLFTFMVDAGSSSISFWFKSRFSFKRTFLCFVIAISTLSFHFANTDTLHKLRFILQFLFIQLLCSDVLLKLHNAPTFP